MHQCKVGFCAYNTAAKVNPSGSSHLSLLSFFLSREETLFAALFTA